jgi:phage-related protein
MRHNGSVVAAKSDKLLVVLHGEIKTPPLSFKARHEVGTLLRQLQRGEMPSMPHSRPMPDVGRRCHELRVEDANVTWRVMYRIDDDAIVVLDVFQKKTRATPKSVIESCQKRLRAYDSAE